MRSKIVHTVPIALFLFTFVGGAPAQTPDMPTSSSSVDPALKDMADKLNQAFGSPIFSAGNLWDEDADTVGARLGWKKDSDSSYQRLDLRQATQLHFQSVPPSDTTLGGGDEAAVPTETDVTVDNKGKSLINCLGSHAYASTLFIRNGKPDFISIIFANDGDISFQNHENQDFKAIFVPDGSNTIAESIAKAAKLASSAVTREYPFLHDQLTGLLGAPSACSYGGAGNNGARSDRWDWKGTSILLCHIPDHLVAITICPIAFADSHGQRPNYNVSNINALLPANVVKSDNGDTFIKGIPALSQGGKEYCIPAVCTRLLRYLDIPCDMYFFAVTAQTGPGGMTTTGDMRNALDANLNPYGLHSKEIDGTMSIENVAAYIDKGNPIIWTCWMQSPVDWNINSRLNIRNPANWQKYLAKAAADKAAIKTIDMDAIKAVPTNSHVRLIVGYNATLGEIAFVDSNSGPNTSRVKWCTLEEAQAISQNDMNIVEPQQ